MNRMATASPPIARRATLVLALMAAALGRPSAPARAAADKADNLDKALNAHAARIIHYLREHHCKNVGVVKFRVQKGKQPVSFKVGPLNDNLPGRLELALSLTPANKAESPIGIIHDADRVAMSRKLPSYTNPAGKRGLFAQKYNLLWDAPSVHPDLFLTGIVSVPPDLKKATVTIEAFHPGTAKMDRVISFPVAMDRSLLVDLNESFQVSSRSLRRRTRDLNLDEEATEDAADKDQAQPTSTNSGDPAVVRAKNTDEKLLDFQILYDGVAQAVTADPNNPGELVVPEPNENQKVWIAVKSVAQERIGLVLMVNGTSTLYEEKQQADVAKNLAWVLDPGRQYVIRGYQQDNQSFKPFRVLSAEDSEAISYNENSGLIHFHIVKQGSPERSKSISDGDQSQQGNNPSSPLNISLRGLKHSDLARQGQTRSLAALRKAYQSPAHRSRKTRGFIVQESDAVEGAIQNDEVKNPVWVQTIVVRYYKPKGT